MTLCLNHNKGDFAIIMEFKVRDEKEEASLEDTAKEAHKSGTMGLRLRGRRC